MNPPPDVIFAQKATAIVKAAGMDPRTIDLERFRQNASLVFSRAYSAIYKEKLLTVLNENSSKEDKILNSQLVLDGLFTKTRNPILLQLSGQDLFDGSHRAIGVLVGILFAEGQRLWLEKIKSIEATLPSISMDETQHEQNQQILAAQDVLDSNEDLSLLHEDDIDESQGFGGHEIRESLRTLNKMRSNPDIAPVELERLLSRIAFLEEQLKHRPKKQSKKKSQKKHIVRRISEAILQDNEINHQGNIDEEHSSDEGSATGMHTTRSSPQNNKNNGDHRNRRPSSSNSPSRHLHSSGGGIKSRPASAPSHRRTTTKIRHPSHRLYNTALGKKEQEHTTGTVAYGSTEPHKTYRGHTHEHEDPNNKQATKIEYFDPAIHTYDWKSGRKILISQAQIEYEERKRQKDAMENILAISENEVDDLMGRRTAFVPNKTAQYPSKSISCDVDKWLQRMGRHRYNDNKRKKSSYAVDDTPSLPEPRYFAAYQKLEERDLIITIEHCYNCSHHNITTRHKQEEYLNHSSNFLRILSQIAYDCNICARVGVSRFKANITETCSTLDENSRIGAFEIQVAYKQHNSGRVIPVTLHSKLASRRWPSKTVLEKRFRAFISHAKISTVQCDFPPPSAATVQMANDSAEPYPVGNCSWSSSPLADPGWSFATTEAKTVAAASNTTATATTATTASATAATSSSISNVQWAFDMREMSDAPAKFEIGSTIRVKKLSFSSGNIERHALLCVVKEYIDSNDIHASDLLVKPMYHAQEVKVSQRNCINLYDYVDREVEYAPDTVPLELATLILLGKQHKLIAWDVSHGEGKADSNGDICLSRRAFYNQVRKLSWAVEKKSPTSKGKGLFSHPQSGEVCDIQHSYSEEVIDWVFNAFKGEGNVSALERMLTPKLSTSTKSAKQSSVSISSNGNDSANPVSRTAPTSVDSARSDPPPTGNADATASISQNTGSTAASPLPDASAHTADMKEATSMHAENSLRADVKETTVLPAAASESSDKGSSLGNSSSPVAAEIATTAGTNDEKPTSSPPPTAAASAAAVDPAATSTQVNDSSQQRSGAAQEDTGGANVEQTVSEQAVATTNIPHLPDRDSQDRTPTEQPPATEVPPPGSDALADTTADSAPDRKPITHRASSVPAKRFSSADLVGAVDQALKSKIIAALCLPDHPYNPSLTAMERMAILYQLSDIIFEEAVVESAERAELSQGSFMTILFRYGLNEALANPTAKEALLGKGKTSSNTPDIPVKVEPFMHWLMSGESTRASASKGAAAAVPLVEKSKSALSVKEAVRQQEVADGGSSGRSKPSSTAANASPRPDSNYVLHTTETPLDPTTAGTDNTSNTTGSGSARTADTSHSKDRSSPLNIDTASADLSTLRTASQKSLLGTAVTSARSAMTAEEREIEAKRMEEHRQSLDYQPKEMQISTITIEGDPLVHASYDTVFINFRIITQQQRQQQEWNASAPMAREKGSKRRTFNVKWPEILISADEFRSDSVIITIAVADPNITKNTKNILIPSLETTEFGVSEHSIKIPLYHFLIPSFDVKAELTLPILTATTTSTTSKVNTTTASTTSNRIKLTIHGNSRDPKSVRTNRIMSMRPQDLMNIKFDPIPLDDADYLLESDNESTDSITNKPSNNPKVTVQLSGQEDEELTRTLFPKASIANMSTVISSSNDNA